MKGTQLHDYELLRLAADHIERVGLMSGDFAPANFTDPNTCQVCTEGAIRVVLCGNPMVMDEAAPEDLLLLDHTKDSLMDWVNDGLSSLGWSLWEWSDQYAQDDKARFVTRDMRFAADLLELDEA